MERAGCTGQILRSHQQALVGGGGQDRLGRLPFRPVVEMVGRQPGAWRREMCAGRFMYMKHVVTAALRREWRPTYIRNCPSLREHFLTLLTSKLSATLFWFSFLQEVLWVRRTCLVTYMPLWPLGAVSKHVSLIFHCSIQETPWMSRAPFAGSKEQRPFEDTCQSKAACTCMWSR